MEYVQSRTLEKNTPLVDNSNPRIVMNCLHWYRGIGGNNTI